MVNYELLPGSLRSGLHLVSLCLRFSGVRVHEHANDGCSGPDLTQQLHGNIMVNRDGGTIFTITFDTDSRGERER